MRHIDILQRKQYHSLQYVKFALILIFDAKGGHKIYKKSNTLYLTLLVLTSFLLYFVLEKDQFQRLRFQANMHGTIQIHAD